MSILGNYNPKQVKLSFAGEDVTEGIAPGTFIVVERTVPRNSLSVGPDGDGTNVVDNNRSGTVTLTLRKGSAINTLLTGKMEEAESSGVPSVGELKLTDFSGKSEADSPKAVLQGFPSDSYGDTESTTEWVFICLELNTKPKGSLEL